MSSEEEEEKKARQREKRNALHRAWVSKNREKARAINRNCYHRKKEKIFLKQEREAIHQAALDAAQAFLDQEALYQQVAKERAVIRLVARDAQAMWRQPIEL